MADGNPYYHPRPSFFDEFSKGVGLGLSMRQASDRAKQIELETQKQKMVMGELQRQRGVEDTMRQYAQGSPAQYAEDPGMTAEAQANPDFAGSGFTPLSVGQETAPAQPQPTLQQIMEFGVRAGASPQQIKSIGDAISMTQKAGPGQFGTDPNYGPYYMDPSGKISSPPAARVQQDRPMNVGSGGAVFDPKTGQVLFQNQAQRRPPADIVNRTYSDVYEVTQDAGAAEAAAAAVKRRMAGAGATGTEEAKNAVRSTPAAAAATTNIEEAKTAGKPLDATTQKDVTSLESIMRQVDNVNANLNPNFLGPVKGKELAFSVRRQVGSYIKSPVGEQEMMFRSSLADISDMLLRQRSGASINETEYKRLRELLPKADDELVPFKAGMKRFATELQAIAESKRKLGKTPRGKLEAGQSGPTMSRDDYMKSVLGQ